MRKSFIASMAMIYLDITGYNNKGVLNTLKQYFVNQTSDICCFANHSNAAEAMNSSDNYAPRLHIASGTSSSGTQTNAT